MYIVKVIISAAVAVLPLAIASGAELRPNILLIVADDLGWRDVGWHGSVLKTPNLDRLVREGVELDQHYVQPVCSPTRVALLTGRYPGRFGPQALRPTNIRALPPGTETLATALAVKGYRTHVSGKWHLGSKPEWGPNHYGFHHSYGTLAGAADPWTHKYRTGPYEATWHRDGKLFTEEGNVTELVAREVESWIRQKRQPWFIYVPFHAVHIPVDAPDEYKELYQGTTFDSDPKKHNSRLRLGAYVSQMDAKVGRFVQLLEQTGQRERTLIVFTSDNGGLEAGGNGYVGKTPGSPRNSENAPLRGQKAQLYEGGIRVAAFVNWKGVLAPSKITAPMHAVDWFPTLAAVARLDPRSREQWEGMDMWPVLTGNQIDIKPRTLFWRFRTSGAIRVGDWKLIEHSPKRVELFDLAVDPYEEIDLADIKSGKVMELRRRLAELSRADEPNLPADLEGLPK